MELLESWSWRNWRMSAVFVAGGEGNGMNGSRVDPSLW